MIKEAISPAEKKKQIRRKQVSAYKRNQTFKLMRQNNAGADYVKKSSTTNLHAGAISPHKYTEPVLTVSPSP